MRARIRDRFGDLHAEREQLQTRLTAPATTTPRASDPTLPDDLKTRLLDAFDIQILWNKPGRQATVHAEITDATLQALPAILNPTPAKYDFGLLTSDLRKMPASYKTGVLPATYKQLYGSSLTSAENWNEVAASVYAYIELKHGINQMLASAMLMYTRYTKPFGNVMAPGSNPGKGHYFFFTSASVKAGWKAWLAGL